MRKKMLVIPAFLTLGCLYTGRVMATSSLPDSVKTPHVADGDLSEWKADKFETDKETQVLYAVDHDAQYLHLALKVPSMSTQFKIMRMGMDVYIDKKGKKREGTGIRFPVRKSEDGGGFGGGRPSGTPGQAPDPKAMRERLASNMILMKTFGFNDEDEKTQMIVGGADGIGIAFSWDDANVLNIEYQVPLSLLGKTTDLNGKPLGIGWKINGMEEPIGSGAGIGGRGGAGGGGGGSRGGGGGTRSAGGDNSTAFRGNDTREQNFWTKYTISF